jgi:Protein of unknown function, DUF547
VAALENTWTFLQLVRMVLARPQPQILNSQQQILGANQALDLARARDFQNLTRAKFSVPSEELEARAFWLNLYNALSLHALHVSNLKRTVLEMPGFFKRFCYRVGDFVFSLDDIEHGVLRGNAPGFIGGRTFLANDPRQAYILALEPRIHFALNCGAVSCPAIRAYEALHLDQQLEHASQAALQDAKIEAGTVWLPRIFSYYQKDFGDPLEFARRYRPDLPAQARVRFLPYFWKALSLDQA